MPVDVSKKNSGYSKFAMSFGVLYCLLFLNIFNFSNEIWPYYAHVVLTKNFFKKEELLIYPIVGIFATSAALYYADTTVFLDLLYFWIIVRTCIVISNLRYEEKLAICKVFETFIIISIVVGFLQLKLPFIMEFTYSNFSGRPSQSVDLLLNVRQAALLLGPEPAYTGMHLLSMLLFINSTYNRFAVSIIYSVIIVILTKSIVVIFGIAILMIYLSVLYRRKFLIYLLGIVTSSIYYLNFDLANSYFERFILFLTELVVTRNLLEAENVLGSVRLLQIYNTQLQLYITEYYKPFTIFGTLSVMQLSPFIAILTLFIMCKICNAKFRFLPLSFVMVFGPVLLWPLLYSLMVRTRVSERCRSE